MLTQIMARQKHAQKESHGIDLDALTTEERVEFIRWNVLALEDELHEALAETSWRPWAKSTHINKDAFTGELVDALHFLVNLFLVVGATSDEVSERYFAKRAKNDKRQAEGYDGVSDKCRVCGRALDDPAVVCTEKECKS